MKVVHCKREPYDVYIGRPGPYGNPYTHKNETGAKYIVESRSVAIESFELYLRAMLEEDRDFVINEYLKPIAGKTLGCWCAPKPCHGSVLIKLCRELGLIDAEEGRNDDQG